MPLYRTHSIDGKVDSVVDESPPYSFIYERLKNGLIRITRENRETGDTLPTIYLYTEQLPEAIRRIFKK